ncbi:hypothetical protein ACETK8_08725 [Brevundimonas staleyi]|uniref:DUF2927 domain-containing protein n=1 Tax=Brevundimonas staleyi TaxID=74326 RepID=A0ABW0FP07_9CAUL
MIGLSVLAGLLTLQISASPAPSQSAVLSGEEDARLEDVVVMGRRLSEATSDFVLRVAAPAADRGPARWRDQICVGVGNLERTAAEYLIDRIASTAESLGLRAEPPGCDPRIFVLFADDPDAAARQLVEARGRRFRIGISGSDRGQRALEEFVQSDDVVRWWQSSAPVNSETGRILGRLPGSPPFSGPSEIQRPSDLGPQGMVVSGSRLRGPLDDNLAQVIVIVDSDRVIGIDLARLADYLTMVALAQIDPDVDPGPYDSILGLFAHPETAPAGMTDWDRAFLQGLYQAEQTARNPRARLSAVADSMAQRVRDQQRAQR